MPAVQSTAKAPSVSQISSEFLDNSDSGGSKKKRQTQFRRCMFTCYDLTKYEAFKTLDLDDEQIRYLTYQLETCPKTKRVHMQGYLEMYRKMRTPGVQKMLGVKCRVDAPLVSSRQRCKDYCQKEDTAHFRTTYPKWFEEDKDGHAKGMRNADTEVVELGEWRQKKGDRTDLHQLYEKINSGCTEVEVYKACPTSYIKYSTGVRRVRALLSQELLNNRYIEGLEVIVVWGASRSGKTRWVLDQHPGTDIYEPVLSSSAGKYWFDGYDGQKVILLNEFYGQLRSHYMQNLLDSYRRQVEKKGDTVISNWNKIYITSNVHPKDWYNQWENIPKKVEQSFIKRITKIIYKEAPTSVLDDLNRSEGQPPAIPTWDDLGGFAPRPKKKRRTGPAWSAGVPQKVTISAWKPKRKAKLTDMFARIGIRD